MVNISLYKKNLQILRIKYLCSENIDDILVFTYILLLLLLLLFLHKICDYNKLYQI